MLFDLEVTPRGKESSGPEARNWPLPKTGLNDLRKNFAVCPQHQIELIIICCV